MKEQTHEPTKPEKEPEANNHPLWNLGPGIAIVALQWFFRFVLPLVFPDLLPLGVIAGLACFPLLLVWWLFFSRAPWRERLLATLLMITALTATPLILHPSITGGMMGLMFFIYALPTLSLAFMLWAFFAQSIPKPVQRLTLVAAILVACAGWALVRTNGMTGGAESDFDWRWRTTDEQRLLADAALERKASLPLEPLTASTAQWPGFRGPNRDSIVHGRTIETDWAATPPWELWRRPVGPGWSSFAVQGPLIYTQEQRGEQETVSCYSRDTGDPVWRYADPVRFWESNAGAGPRATPTLSNNRVYTFGATGILNVLNAADGALIWSRNVAVDAGVEAPTWGFSGSPLVLEDLVVVAAAGNLVAYNLDGGAPRWLGPSGKDGYSSPHLLTLKGTPQVLLSSSFGLTSLAPADGALLWQKALPGFTIVQPAAVPNGDDLLICAEGEGVRRLSLARDQTGWRVDETWSSPFLKGYFNDFVIHKGHAYGFDGRILGCIGLDQGERVWKGGRYGNGQLLLLADQDLLLVLSEKGQLALVKAQPEGFTQLAEHPALQGKTWNHPVLVDDMLLVRNDTEMAAFRLAPPSAPLE